MRIEFDNNSLTSVQDENENFIVIIPDKNDFGKIVYKPENGYGACKSCKCTGWIPNNPKNDYCKNCGHHWEQHR